MKVQPFFTRYLETQKTTAAVTRKYPSDNEDGAGTPAKTSTMVTLRYPSDGEDMGAATPLKTPSNMVTMRYPSDSEDCDAKPPSKTYQTMKYPSDSEDAGDCAGHHNRPHENKGLQDMVKQLLERLLEMLFGGGSSSPQKPGNVVTLKFPSDSEDLGG